MNSPMHLQYKKQIPLQMELSPYYLLLDAPCICFGSESGNIDDFYKTYHFLNQNDDAYKAAIREFLQQGNSYPKALSLAFESLSPARGID